jgi:hypothetical protein
MAGGETISSMPDKNQQRKTPFRPENAHDRQRKAAVMRIMFSRLPEMATTAFGES